MNGPIAAADEPSRWIGRCRACRQTSAREYTLTVPDTAGTGIYWREVRRFGRFHPLDPTRFIRASDDFACPRCGAGCWEGKPIAGTVTDTMCGARCRNSKGPDCQCACGGRQHGLGFVCS